MNFCYNLELAINRVKFKSNLPPPPRRVPLAKNIPLLLQNLINGCNHFANEKEIIRKLEEEKKLNFRLI